MNLEIQMKILLCVAAGGPQGVQHPGGDGPQLRQAVRGLAGAGQIFLCCQCKYFSLVCQVSREEQDRFGARSHALAAAAQEAGLLADLVPVTVPDTGATVTRCSTRHMSRVKIHV